MARKQAWLAILCVAAGSGLAQTVEYATRNVEPTHAVRFGAQPLRITITDRGERLSRGDLEPVRSGKSGHVRRHVLRGGRTRIFGFGGYVHRSDNRQDDRPVSLADRNRSRTVYGSDQQPEPVVSSDGSSSRVQRDRAAEVQDPAAREAARRARDERRQRLYDRLLPLFESRRQGTSEEEAKQAPETADAEALSEADGAAMIATSE